ncbi:MAG TPA: SCP2 sterol-binding domain-containing protein [Steroidobacteraceae bacterium]|nr:SCP2 sterol-binding domain-containing protein [Steroidobacteraceae bacterium]
MSAAPVDALLRQLATVLNRNVGQSTRATTLTAQLDGRVLALALEGTPVTLYFKIGDGRIAIDTRHEGDVDARLAGTPLGLLSLVGRAGADGMRSAGVRIEGDAEVAQRFQNLLQQAQPDFEEELSRVIGDVAAHQVANLARGILGWGRKAADSFAQNVAEYLQEEGRDVPTRVEIEEFLEAVDHLREAADRLEARLARLESQRRDANE